jgi:putative protease
LVSNFKRLLNKFPHIILSLPPVILPRQLDFFKKAVIYLSNLGFKCWHLANIGHFPLLLRIKDLILTSDYTFNVANHLALCTLKSFGVRFLTLSLELDKEALKQITKCWSPQDLIIMVYIRTPLWISRLSLKSFWQNVPLISPLGELYYPIVRDEITYILPEIPVSLGAYLKELQSFGINQFGVDLRFVSHKKTNRIVAKKGVFLPKGYSFNYRRKWI